MDERLRAQVRHARESGDGQAALAAAHALARVREGDLAADLAGLAAHVGAEGAGQILARLVPPGLAAFQQRTVGVRFERGRVGALAWSPDGARIFAVCGSKTTTLVAFERASGASTTLAELPRRGRALAADRAGRVAVAMRNAQEDGNDVAIWADGVLGSTLLATRDWYRALGFAPASDRLLTATTKAVRAYGLSPAEKKASWATTGNSAAFSSEGAVIVRKPGTVRLFDLGQRKPRVEVDLAAVCPGVANPQVMGWPEVAAVGKGALLIYQSAEALRPRWDAALPLRAVRLSPEGEVTLRRDLTHSDLSTQRWACSPTGRYLALGMRADPESSTLRAQRLALFDLEGGDPRIVELPALPRCHGWSPSGEALAVGTDEGTLVLLDASASGRGVAPEPSTPARDEQWTELRKGDRFWRARVTATGVELHYGLRGAAGTRSRSQAADPEKEHARRVREKRRQGYREAQAS